ncbi:MAG: hypothetical protein QXH08_03555, partial [Candidatus Hadarchaeales archaeon]
WNIGIQAVAQWKEAERWTATVKGMVSGWRPVEAWGCTIGVIKMWRAVEVWSSAIRAIASWRRVESWSVSITTPPIPDFTISVSPSAATVQQGASGTATVTIQKIGDYSNSVSLTASGVPSGVAVTFSPSSGTPPFAALMTISVGRTVPPGTYPITITGRDGEGKVHTTTFTLTVTGSNFSLLSDIPPDHHNCHSNRHRRKSCFRYPLLPLLPR